MKYDEIRELVKNNQYGEALFNVHQLLDTSMIEERRKYIEQIWNGKPITQILGNSAVDFLISQIKRELIPTKGVKLELNETVRDRIIEVETMLSYVQDIHPQIYKSAKKYFMNVGNRADEEQEPYKEF